MQSASARILSPLSTSMTEAVTVPPSETLEEEARVPTRRILVFMLGERQFASDFDAFREIITTRHATRLPGAPKTVSGLINLRGTIVTVLDGGVTLGGQPCVKAGGLTLLVDCEGKLIGLGVDDVRDIHDVPVNEFGAADPGELAGLDCVTGSVEIEGRRVLVLDVRALTRQVIGHGR